MNECSKCGGNTIKGEIYVDIDIFSPNQMMGGMMSSMSGMNFGNNSETKKERIKWREKTGEKKGFLIKRDELRTFAVIGRRCLECGYIELIAQE